MTSIVAVRFDHPQSASKARVHLASCQDLLIDDAAVIVKNEDGSTQITHELDRGVKRGALRGALIGLLIGGLFAPTAGLVLGGLVGVTVGRSRGLGIPHVEVNRLADQLAAGESALMVHVQAEQHDLLLSSLDLFGGALVIGES